MLFLFAVFAAGSVAAQDHNELQRTGFNRLTIGEQKFSLQDADEYIKDARTIDRINRGIRIEKAAIITGVVGAAAFGGALAMIITNPSIPSMVAGYPIMGVGILATIASVPIGISGAVITRKAIRRYNNGLMTHSSLLLTPVVTPGGLGLQLTF